MVPQENIYFIRMTRFLYPIFHHVTRTSHSRQMANILARLALYMYLLGQKEAEKNLSENDLDIPKRYWLNNELANSFLSIFVGHVYIQGVEYRMNLWCYNAILKNSTPNQDHHLLHACIMTWRQCNSYPTRSITEYTWHYISFEACIFV